MQINRPRLFHSVPGLALAYDGWEDKIFGWIKASHSNRKETRPYSFECIYNKNKLTLEIANFRIHAEKIGWSDVKGTARENRKDIKMVALRVSSHWRQQKLREQEIIQELIKWSAPVEIKPQVSYLTDRPYQPVAWLFGTTLFIKPSTFDWPCAENWIETIPIGVSDTEIAKLIGNAFADGPPQSTCGAYFDEDVPFYSGNIYIKAAQSGLTLDQIKQVCTIAEEDWKKAQDLIEVLSRI